MPPKKRTASEAGPSAQSGPARGNKNSKKAAGADVTNDASSEEHEEQDGDKDLENRPPHKYYGMPQPFFDVENENEDKDEDDQLDEDEIIEAYNEEMRSDDGPAMKPAADFPDNRWVCMWETWKQYADYKRRATYTDPDSFGMYIYNDFHGYGLQELIESMLVAFDKELRKKRDDENLKQMWATTAAMIHWLLDAEIGPWLMTDDGERVSATVGFVGRALATVLNELDLAQKMTADSEIKDLGLVMSCYLQWVSVVQDQGFDEKELEWRKETAGCHGTDKNLSSLEEEYCIIGPLSGKAKADRWSWKKNFTQFKKEYGATGGEKFNILKMSRKERADHAFSKKDPLAQFSDEDLRSGKIMLSSG
ncbi:Uu.00g127170.m01.CDS01 [Anthostomella pinea]|uniref:Uu.00g127170.m01.CDS01 n=1 Tax=Anthostomella pinea TaxID=933095 RepID=A0AAI8YFG0_9PEZI|nr:Uu.00g127170.m01.CDS01 [Anthostomella pinea]